MNRHGFWDVDWFLILPVAILVIISLVTLFSLSIDFFKSQALFLVVSLLAFIFFAQSNYSVLKVYSKPIYFISLILLVLIFFLGVESRGSIRWIELLGFRIQFAEILKPFLAISFATYLVEMKNYNFRSLINIFLLLTPIIILIFFQPDLGDALIYLGVVIATVLYFGFPFRYFVSLFLPALLALPFIWNFLHYYQRQRILTFFNPGNDPLGTSYNVIQSIIAIGSGKIMGKGLGQGTQSGLRFLPERNTDFIFATIAEQLGLIGTTILLICFGIVLYKIYMIHLNANDRFCKVFSVIVFFSFLIQIFVNIGMNMGILPIVGVTLPFMSSGGSSLLSNFIFLGLIVAVSRSARQSDVLEIR